MTQHDPSYQKNLIRAAQENARAILYSKTAPQMPKPGANQKNQYR